MPTAQLGSREARLAYLATVYHLGRPGSELDAASLERHDLGLGSVRAALEPLLELAVVELELTDYQLHRLGEALYGVVNELKQFELSGGRSTVPGFVDAVTQLFPEVTPEDPGAALDLTREAVMLRRRLDVALREAAVAVEAARAAQALEAEAARRPWWKVWG